MWGSCWRWLAVYLGGSVTNLSLISANDNDETNLSSAVCFNAIADQNYKIVVDGFDAAAGNVTLSLDLHAGQFLFSSAPRGDFWVPDGPVQAMLATNGIIYLRGDFNYIRPNRGTGIALDIDSNAPGPTFPQ